MTPRLPSCIVWLALVGCAQAPPLPPPLPQVPAAFKRGPARLAVVPPAEAWPRGSWWLAFADPVLDQLVQRAGRDNTDLAAAGARWAQARALLLGSTATGRPQLGVAAGVSRQGGPLLNAAGASGTLITAAASLSYEPDLFGRLVGASNAAALDAQAREALLQSTRLLVQAEVAQTYLALRAADAERTLAGAGVAALRETLRLTELRWRAGSLTEQAVARTQADVATAEAEALVLARRRAELEHALAVLLGEPASAFTLTAAPWAATLPQVPAGIPSEMLARRPDVAAAQHTLMAAQARAGVARTAWFPSLALTASGGHASPDLGTLLQASMRAWGASALLALPLFDGGRREAAVAQAQAEADVALAGARAQILHAFREVEDQLLALRVLAEQAEWHSRATAAASRAAALSASRWRNGLASQMELLDAQRQELHSQRLALQVQAAQQQATVGLIRALGGDWNPAPAAFGQAAAAGPV